MAETARGTPGRLLDEAARREAAGLRRQLRHRNRDDDSLLDLASNDYLGLARDPRVVEAAVQATRRWGAGSTGSRLVTGSTTLHAELDQRLAEFGGAPAALVFSSGYLANLAAVTVLSGRGTLVVSDAGNHASIVDACRLSRARVAVTQRGDVTAVQRALDAREEENAIVVTDAIFSADGDRAPIRELYEVCHERGVLLVIDEAHSYGVLGEGGRGAVWDADLASAGDVVRTVTLSKALGSQGGAVLATTDVIDAMVNTGRSFIFDTGLAPASVGAALGALTALRGEPERPARALSRARELASLASGYGFEAGAAEAAVVPVFLGDPKVTLDAAALCADHGVRVGCFRPPSVPEGRSCLRLTARATLTDDDMALVDKTLNSVASFAFS